MGPDGRVAPKFSNSWSFQTPGPDSTEGKNLRFQETPRIRAEIAIFIDFDSGFEAVDAFNVGIRITIGL